MFECGEFAEAKALCTWYVSFLSQKMCLVSHVGCVSICRCSLYVNCQERSIVLYLQLYLLQGNKNLNGIANTLALVFDCLNIEEEKYLVQAFRKIYGQAAQELL